MRCTPLLLPVVSVALLVGSTAHAQTDTTLARRPSSPDSTLPRSFESPDSTLARATGTFDSTLVHAPENSIDSALAAIPRASVPAIPDTAFGPRFRDRADSMAWVGARELVDDADGFRVIVSTFDRQLWVLDGPDTLLSAPVAVGVDTTITYGAKTWRFNTPYGRRAVLRKEANPIWVPPDWHYVEVAARRDLKLTYLSRKSPVPLRSGSRLTVRNNEVGLLKRNGTFEPLPHDEEIVFEGKLFVPPLGTKNRQIPGELGKFRLDLGDGYLLHGTPYENTIGAAATHGCIRLREDDITWLYDHVPVGTRVFIY